MLDGCFKELAALVCGATPREYARLEPAFGTLAERITALVEPDVYTDGALDGVRAALAGFAAVLRQADTLPRFTVARRRHNAHEAVWALHDELGRQCSQP